MVSNYCPKTAQHVVIIFTTQQVTIATVWPAKNTLNYSFRGLQLKNGTVQIFYIIDIW